MKNFICIDGKKTELDSDLSLETAKNKLKGFLGKCKPKELRHGDWWYTNSNKHGINIYLKQYNEPYADCVALSDCLITNIGSSYKGEPIEGNIIDDLKRNAEDLKEFSRNNLANANSADNPFTIEINGSCVDFRFPERYCSFYVDEAQEFHQKLGQLIAKVKREQTKKDC